MPKIEDTILNDTCIQGCMGEYQCGKPFTAIDAESQSPYIIIKFVSVSNEGGGTGEEDNEGNFIDSDVAITVGNESAPKFGNDACITSLEFGMGQGLDLNFEVMDEQGGAFHMFVDKVARLVADEECEIQQMSVRAQFGWIQNRCDGSSVAYPPIGTREIHAVVAKMDVEFADGKVKFKVETCDTVNAFVFATRNRSAEGDDEEPIPLKEAIENMWTSKEPPPPGKEVRFQRIEADGDVSDDEWEFEGGEDSPKGTWCGNSLDKLATIKNWCSSYVTDRRRGLNVYVKSDELGVLIIMEDQADDPCADFQDCGPRSVGTFVVNGGMCSNVISFNPTLSWKNAFQRVGAGGGDSTTTGKTEDKDENREDLDCDRKVQPSQDVGTQQFVMTNRNSERFYGEEALKKTDDAQEAQRWADKQALKAFAGTTAQMVLQGDPSPAFMSTIDSVGTYCSVIVINPFHIRAGGGNRDCGDWLAIGPCNEVLSNKKWQITKVSHSIKGGSFQTTLDLLLASPGSELEQEDAPFGKSEGGYIPPSQSNCLEEDFDEYSE